MHSKLRLSAGGSHAYEFTSRFFFDADRHGARGEPYTSKGRRSTSNTTDGIDNGL